MFENLTSKFQKIFSKLRSFGGLTEKQVEEALREVRLALLEADCNLEVVKDFISKVKEKAVGEKVLKSLSPGEQVIKIVHEELVKLMGPAESELSWAPKPPTLIMLAGLHGSGKTTATAKLAAYLKRQGKKPFMIAADIYRPAAIDQLKTLGEELKIPVFTETVAKVNPLQIAQNGFKEAELKGFDPIILDTAGRLHINEEMMSELKEIKMKLKPAEILLVVDATVGQDAVRQALSFKEKVDFDGLILTKLDGDARGGAALSIKAVTGKPIKFVSLGEKLDSLQIFYPERMASRILGMGDVLTLIEKAEAETDEKQAKALEEKFLKAQFSLEDFLNQLKQVKKMGPLPELLKMLPGAGNLPAGMAAVSDKEITKVEAIIQSMTRKERLNPKIITGSRRSRIAKGSGTNSHAVNQLLNQFEMAKKLMKNLSSGKLPFGLGKMGKGVIGWQ